MSTEITDQVPVTVICGPLGAGKTTLVNRLLAAPGGRQIAVIVNDMGEINVDAELIETESEDGIVDLSNGCICCRLQGDLVEQARRLSAAREFDHLVVEASGISEPLPIARTLTGGAGETDDPPAEYDLDAIVAVIDAYGFWKAFDPDESLPDAAPDPERPLTDVLVDQIEFCNVLLLNKCDMVPDDALDEIEATIRELQPEADLHRTVYSELSPDVVLDTGRFDFETAKRSPGWKQVLAGDGTDTQASGHVHGAHDHREHGQSDHDHGEAQSAADRHGVESIVYERHRPFDPEQFDDWLDDWDGALIRAKGFVWVSSRPDEVLGVNQAGPSVQAGPIGEWGEKEPATKLVLIGRELDEQRLGAELDSCLAAEDGEGSMTAASDPFPRENQ